MPRSLLKKAGVLLLWLAVWAGAAAAVRQPLLLPSPMDTLHALLRLAGKGAFWLSAGASLLRIAAGFVIGMLAGAALAILMSRFEACRAFLSPALSAIRATPVASFIVLALVWMRSDSVPIFATVLVVLPAVCANLMAGIAATDPDLLEMARAFRFSRRALLTKLYLPSVRPYFAAAVTAGMGMAWKAGVAAEIITLPRHALGSRLHDAKVYLDTPALFAGTLVVIALSILLEQLVTRWTAPRARKEARHAKA